MASPINWSHVLIPPPRTFSLTRGLLWRDTVGMLLRDTAWHHDINRPKYLDSAGAVKFASGSVYTQPSGHTSLKDSNRAWLCTTGSRRHEGRVNDTQWVSSKCVRMREMWMSVGSRFLGFGFSLLSPFPWRVSPEFKFE